MGWMSNAYEGSVLTEEEEYKVIRCALRFVTKKVACIHRLRTRDIPRGLFADDVMLDCKDDPKCPFGKRRT